MTVSLNETAAPFSEFIRSRPHYPYECNAAEIEMARKYLIGVGHRMTINRLGPSKGDAYVGWTDYEVSYALVYDSLRVGGQNQTGVVRIPDAPVPAVPAITPFPLVPPTPAQARLMAETFTSDVIERTYWRLVQGIIERCRLGFFDETHNFEDSHVALCVESRFEKLGYKTELFREPMRHHFSIRDHTVYRLVISW